MAERIEAEVRGTGTRSVSLQGHASYISGDDAVRRAVALELAISSFHNSRPPGTEELLMRAQAFAHFIEPDGKA